MIVTILSPEVVVPGMRAMTAGHMYEVDAAIGKKLVERGQAIEANPSASSETPEKPKAERKPSKNAK